MATDDPRPDPEPTNVRWIVFALGCGTSWILYLHRYTFALIKPKLQEELSLGEAELGMLDSAFAMCYSVFQFPSGILADLVGAHLFLGGIILVWSIGMGMHAWAPDVNALWYARAMLGGGQAGAFASVNRITRTWFPTAIRTSVQGWVGIFSGRIGGLSANLLFATVLIGVFGLDWRTAVYVLAAAGIVHGVLFLLLFRNSPRTHPLANQAEADLIEDVTPRQRVKSESDQLAETSSSGTALHNAGTKSCPTCGAEAPATAVRCDRCGEAFPVEKPRRMPVKEMFRRMSRRSVLNLLALNLQTTLSTIADNLYSNWIPLFLANVHGLKFKEMGIYSALPLLGGACGGAFGGWFNDYLIRTTGNRRWSRRAVAMMGKGTAGVALFLALLAYDNPYRFCMWLFVVKFFSDWSLSSSWGTVTDIGGKTTATVFAFNNSVASIGAIVAPMMYGFVAEFYGWKPVFVIAGVAYFLCASAWLLVNCTIPVLAEEERVRIDN